MITCSSDKQKQLLTILKRLKKTSQIDIVNFSKTYLGIPELISIDLLIDSFTSSKEDLLAYLEFVGINWDAKTNQTVGVQERTPAVSNVSANFTSPNVQTLFTGLHTAGIFFQQEHNRLIMSAIYLGEKDSEYESGAAVTKNLNNLKNQLFKQITDFLIKKNILDKKLFYEVHNTTGEEIFIANLFNTKGEFIGAHYDSYYRMVIDAIENYFIGPGKTTTLLPNSNQLIPSLKQSFDDPIAKNILEIYNATILLLNFDIVLKTSHSDVLHVDLKTFNSFNSPINVAKYSRRVKGLETEFFMDDDHASNGVSKIQDKLTHKLISIVPILDSSGNRTNQFLDMKDLTGLGAVINMFQTQKFNDLVKLNNWVPLESDPIKMLPWYLEQIIKASETVFIGEMSTLEQLAPDKFFDFRDKVNVAKSILAFLKSVESKEKNAKKFSMLRIFSQALINSVGATYSMDYTDSNYRKYKEMHTHNSERVQLQESIYSHLKNKQSNFTSLLMTNEFLNEQLVNLEINKLRSIITTLTGIQLTNTAVTSLIDKWTSDLDMTVSADQLHKNKVTKVVSNIEEIISKIFPSGISDLLPTETEVRTIVKGEEKVIIRKTKKSLDELLLLGQFTDSILSKILDNENNKNKNDFEGLETTNAVISPLSKNKILGDILDIKLESIVVRILNTISKKSGALIPTAVIPSMGFSDSSILYERSLIEKQHPGLYKNFFLEHGGLLGTTIRLESIAKDKEIDASKLNIVENFTSHFEFDFLDAIKNGDSSKINIMIGNYADKARILDKSIDKSIKLNEEFIIARPIESKSKVKTATELWENGRERSKNYYTDLSKELLTSYMTLDPKLTKTLTKLAETYTEHELFMKSFEAINKFLSSFTYEQFLTYIYDNDLNFTEELHYTKFIEKIEDDKGNKTEVMKVALNNTIIDYVHIYLNEDIFGKFKQYQHESFIHKLLELKNGNNLLLSNEKYRLISSEKKKFDETIFKGMLISLGIDPKTYFETFVTKTGDHQIYIENNGNIAINPLIDKWLAVNEFFRNEYLYMTVKPEYMHPLKSNIKRDYKIEQVDNFIKLFSQDSGKRLSGMAKRNVSFTGSTEIPSRKGRYNTTDDVNVAIIQDYAKDIGVISGEENNLAIHDGGTLIPFTYSKLIDHSYQSKGYTGTKKQLGTLVTEFGSALKKDAESVLTNASIRNSRKSEINFKYKQQQVYAMDIQIDYYNSGSLSSNNTFFKDGEYYKLTSYIITDNKFLGVYSIWDRESKTWVKTTPTNPVKIKNLYDLWELFGAEFSVNNNFKFNEGSNELLFDLMTSYEVDQEYVLKNKMIHIISNHSCFKSGASRIHTGDFWTNNKLLRHTVFRNKNMGVQLDSSHDIEGSKMKEVTQLISALSQNPDTIVQANEMYNNLANTIQSALKKIYRDQIKADNLDSLEDLYNSLSKKLVRSLANSDVQSLAKTIAESFEYGKALPFSNQNFFKDFIKQLVNDLNKDYITRYYPGTGATLTPSHKIITIFENKNGEIFTQEDLYDLAIKAYIPIKGQTLTTDQIIDTYINLHFGDQSVRSDQVQFLESVRVNGKVIELDSLKKYYDFKDTYKDTMVSKVYAATRDLKPIEISYDINTNNKTVTQNLFDLDSVKLKFLNNLNKKSYKQYNDFLTQFKEHFKITSKENLQIKLDIWTQRQLQLISKGKVLRSIFDETLYENGNFKFDEYFGTDELTSINISDFEAYYNKSAINITNYQKKAAEVILGNIHGDIFKTGTDSIAFIRSKKVDYFKDKLKDIYTIHKDFINVEGQKKPATKAAFKIGTEERDVYVQFVLNGQLPAEKKDHRLRIIEEFDEKGTLHRFRMDSNGEKMYEIPANGAVYLGTTGYDILYIEVGEVKSKPIAKTENSTGTTDVTGEPIEALSLFLNHNRDKANEIMKHLIGSFNSGITGIVPIMNNDFKANKETFNINNIIFNYFKEYSGYVSSSDDKINKHFLENNLEKILDQVATKTYISWEKSHEYVAARIPAQSMQSFMEMKNVGYFNTTNNETYVSIWQILIQGSDYDIDKVYLMGHGFNKAGHYEVWNDKIKFNTIEELNELESFPLPSANSIPLTNVYSPILPNINKVSPVINLSNEFLMLADSFGGIDYINQNLKSINIYNLQLDQLKIFKTILTKVKNYKGINIAWNITPESDVVVKLIMELLNNYNTKNEYTKNKFSQTNSIVATIKSIISNPANQLFANKPVDIQPLKDGADKAVSLKNKKIINQIEELTKVLPAKTELKTLAPEDLSKAISTIEQIFDIQFITLKNIKTVEQLIAKAQEIKLIKNTLSAHDMLSMFKQQSDAIIGKTDVGIGANGLKAFFALSNYYSNYYKSLKVSTDAAGHKTISNNKGQINIMTDPKWFKKEFHMGGTIGTVIKTTLADVWLNKDLHEVIMNTYGLKDLKHQLQIIETGRAAIYMSGFVSGATDNAKELVMAKINAIENLASIHLYLMALGFSMEEVAIYMNSDLVNHIIKVLGNKNIYDSSENIYITDIVSKYKENHKEEADLCETFIDIYYGSKEMSALAGLLKINQRTSADIDSMYEYLNKFNKAMYSAEHNVLNEGLLGLKNGVGRDKLIKKIMKENPNNLSYDYIDEVLEEASSINVQYIDKDGLQKSKYVSMVGGQFDVRYFIIRENKAYRDIAIKYYNLFKNTFNIFDVVLTSPHYKAMIDGLSSSHTTALIVSKKYNFVFNYAIDVIREKSKEVQSNNYSKWNKITTYMGNAALPLNITDKMVNKLFRGFDGFLISSWLKTSDTDKFKFSIKDLLSQLQSFELTNGIQEVISIDLYTDNRAKSYESTTKNPYMKTFSTDVDEDFIVDLSTDYGMANFKKVMEQLILPILQKSNKSELGQILRTKTIKNPYGINTSQITALFGISSLDTAVNIAKYQELLYTFNEADTVIEERNKIKNKNGVVTKYKDLFYLYNLIVNNEQYGDNRLTSIFQDYVKDRESIAYKYLDYSRKVDLRQIDIFKIDIDETITNPNEKNTILDQMLENQKNDILFLALNNQGLLSVKRLNNSALREIKLKNSDFIVNTFMDVTDNKNLELHTMFLSLLSVFRDSNLLINFKCD